MAAASPLTLTVHRGPDKRNDAGPDNHRVTTPTPRLLLPGTALWPLERVLALKSGEADLLCRTGVHVAGHPHYCPNGCVLAPDPRGTVAAVLPYKRHTRLWDNPTPATVEDGWLLDGHHRAVYACRTGKQHVWVREVTGQLHAYQARWAHIADQVHAAGRSA